MGFHEKSAWACLLSIGLVYVPYFAVVLRHPMAALGFFVLATIALVVLLVIFHIVNAVATRSIRATGDTPPVDELDQRIELHAAKWAGFGLAAAVLAWILRIATLLPVAGVVTIKRMAANGVEVSPADFAVPVLSAMAAVQWLFAAFVIANVVYYGVIVIGYRRLARA
ncbi:MAG: hypothetical protein AAFV43_02155 [Planctomycetota bacterium]